MKSMQNRPVNKSVFVFHKDMTIVSFCPKKTKALFRTRVTECALIRLLMGKTYSHEISASVWDRCPTSIVMHLGSYDRNSALPYGGAEENSLRHRDSDLGFQLYVQTLYPLSHTGFQLRCRIESFQFKGTEL
ncbi:hypothetical protein ANN_15390 [Periplaneta americana]|uniref:Uncharacterized protein n=1 Tax=Periplaneta americana TaxID=6978 RepID=A0ABQ8SGP7_PERAM|nr:hypothetical protein ANN_15390 [Periplaneta americana]